jgi:hypothetical protein
MPVCSARLGIADMVAESRQPAIASSKISAASGCRLRYSNNPIPRDGGLVLIRDRHADEHLTQIFRGAFREGDANILFHKDG